jgi:hypothetical protein
MGAIFQLLLRGLQFGGPAAIGYFINDLGSWIAKATGTEAKVVDTKTGGWKWWYVFLIVIVAGVALIMVIKMVAGFAGGRRKKGGLGI